MHVYHKNDVAKPFETPHGEIIYELLGREVGEPSERHSVAYAVIPPGKASLLHYHPTTEESYYILKGQGRIQLEDEEAMVGPGQVTLIPPPKPHKIFNVGHEDLEFLAFCVPAWEPTNTVWLEKWTEEGAKPI